MTVQLHVRAEWVDGTATCRSCGGRVSLMVGYAFTEEDLPVFDDVRSAIEQARLSPLESASLALSVAEAAAGFGEEAALNLTIAWLPHLAPLRYVLEAAPARARQSLSMVDVILRARSRRPVNSSG